MKKKKRFQNRDQAEDDEVVDCRNFDGPVTAVGANLACWAPPDGLDACRRMTMRPSE